MTNSLSGRTLLMSGGSRGIGLAIALAAARHGANIALLAKTAQPHPKLEGTIHTAAAAIEAVGGHALPVVGDVREEDSVIAAVEQAVAQFGSIDIVVNNASALDLGNSVDLPVKKFDLLQQIQIRGTFLLTRTAVPHLRKSANPHILSLSPPLNLSQRWLGEHPPYMVAKYGMTLLTLGFAAEFATDGIAANCLWPQTLIATAAVQNLLGGDSAVNRARTPDIVADAALHILTQPADEFTGRTAIDVDILAEAGVTDLSGYGIGTELEYDIFVDPPA
ncbi:SDR family oxidoreductase [Nocardia stercoris]|uniref:NAD(P)-dependent oxidoreductase n=1 Tax=Nocardia stercoris TaxID=2483361 RepID=A0A3M2KXF3_9NOCA|nr:NAD(P)-dependent oxidoreductase [Nocardia stercoris]RMI30189.1 NAD(P)-dependent oxidoreductase [Nocardia stercoris]